MGVREPVRTYRHALFDSSRWKRFVARPDDIVIATSMKAGTTWTQGIVCSLLWPAGDPPAFHQVLSPWLDVRWDDLDEVIERLESQQHRRFIKTHTAADGIPIYDDTKYIVVGRDGRDVFMSILNHWDRMRRGLILAMNETRDPGVAELPLWDGDVHGAFDTFISRGSFEWEGDGAPWWSHFHHCATWWALKDEPNVLLVHYNDLLRDLDGEMRRIAGFLDIDVPDALWAAAVERCRLDEMREDAARSGHYDQGFIRGAESFFYKGSNGRWRDVLTSDELARYERRVNEVLPPDAAHWLENGRLPVVRSASSG